MCPDTMEVNSSKSCVTTFFSSHNEKLTGSRKGLVFRLWLKEGKLIHFFSDFWVNTGDFGL